MNCLGTPHFGVASNYETPDVLSPFDPLRAAYVGSPEVIDAINTQEDKVAIIEGLRQRENNGNPILVDACRLSRPDLHELAMQGPHAQADLLIATVLQQTRVRREQASAAEVLLSHNPKQPYADCVISWLGAISARRQPDLYSVSS